MTLQRFEKILFYSFVFLLPFQFRITLHQYGIITLAEYNSLFLYLTDVILVGLLIISLVQVIKKVPFPKSVSNAWQTIHEIEPLYWFLIGFWVLTALASFPQRNIGLSIYQVVKMAEVILLFAYVTLAFRRYNLSKVIVLFLASSIAQAMLAFLQFAFENSFPAAKFFVEKLFLIRSYGTLPHPNGLALFLAIGLFFCFYLLMKRRFFEDYPNPNFLPREEQYALFKDSLIRVMLLLLNFLLVAALFLTFSRIILILLFLILAFDFYFLFKSKWFIQYQKRLRYIVMIFIGCVLLAGILVLPELIVRSQAGISSLARGFHFFDPRALEFIWQEPLFGSGAGYYMFKLYQEYPTLNVSELQPVNNLYLLIGAETGLISLGFFVAFLVYLFYGLLKAYTQEKDLSAKFWKSQLLMLFMFIIVVSFFTNALWVFQQGRLLYWFLLAVMVATATGVEKGNKAI